MKNSSRIQCNGQKIRDLRMQKSMTQEKLAHMSDVNHRTVQRAERNQAVQLETIASLAAALQVTVSDITVSTNDNTIEQQNLMPDEQNAVVLRQINSGKILMDLILNSFSSNLSCETEPTNENIDDLSAIVQQIEKYIPNPWEIPFEENTLTLAERLRIAVAITTQLAELTKMGIAVFGGHYTARAQIPRYDDEEGCMYIKSGQKYEPVTVSKLTIVSTKLERIIVKVDDKWQEPAPLKIPEDFDDEIPF